MAKKQKVRKCCCLSCGYPEGTTGVPVDEIGTKAAVATLIAKPVSSKPFPCCAVCKDRHYDHISGIEWEPLTTDDD